MGTNIQREVAVAFTANPSGYLSGSNKVIDNLGAVEKRAKVAGGALGSIFNEMKGANLGVLDTAISRFDTWGKKILGARAAMKEFRVAQAEQMAISKMAGTPVELGGVAALGAAAYGARNALAATGIAAVGVAAVGAAAGLGHLAHAQADTWESTDRMAKALGVSYNTVTTLRVAADRLGLPVDAANASMARFTRTLGTALTPAGKDAREAFMSMGISWKELQTMSAADAFDRVAKQLNALPPGADRAAAAFKVFGKGYMDILPIIDSLDEAKAAVDRFGLSLTDEGARRMADLDTAADNLRTSLQGLKKMLAEFYAPVATVADTSFAWLIGKLQQPGLLDMIANKIMGPTAASQVVAPTDRAKETLERRRLIQEATQEQIGRAGEMLKGSETPAERMQRSLNEIEGLRQGGAFSGQKGAYGSAEYLRLIEGVNEQFRKSADYLRDVDSVLGKNDAAQEYTEHLQNLNKAMYGGWIDARQYAQALQGIQDTYKEAMSKTPAAVAAEQMRDRAKAIHDATRGPMDELRDKTREIDQLFSAGFLSRPDYVAALSAYRAEFLKAANGADAMGNSVEKADRAMRTTAAGQGVLGVAFRGIVGAGGGGRGGGYSNPNVTPIAHFYGGGRAPGYGGLSVPGRADRSGTLLEQIRELLARIDQRQQFGVGVGLH